jgi:hypothetical protein
VPLESCLKVRELVVKTSRGVRGRTGAMYLSNTVFRLFFATQRTMPREIPEQQECHLLQFSTCEINALRGDVDTCIQSERRLFQKDAEFP